MATMELGLHNDTSKIRINELARELEVKPSRILDLLPELGVTEKKTHSSSIEDDVALKVRRYFGHDEPDTPRPPRRPETAESESEGAVTRQEELEKPVSAEKPSTPATAVSEADKPAPVAAPEPRFVPRPASPVRPPLAGQVSTPPPPAN